MRAKNVPCLRLLLDAGASLNATDSDGWTALHHRSRGPLDVVLELLSAGADVSKCAEGGVSALHMSTQEGHGGVVRALLKAGADVKQATQEGMSALHIAAAEGFSDVVSALLKAGADVNQVDNDGETPLMRAQNVPCVRLLLDACAGGRAHPAGVICSLLQAGCDPTALNNAHETPADVARRVGNEDAAALLERLAEQALTNSDKSSIVSKISEAAQEGKKEGSGLPTESETRVHVSAENRDIVGSHEPVITCSNNDSEVAEKVETEGRSIPSEPLAGVPMSIEDKHTVRIYKKVKPCAHCGTITHKRCSGCIVTHYCSRDCQRATYSQHKKECTALRERNIEAKAQRAAAKGVSGTEDSK